MTVMCRMDKRDGIGEIKRNEDLLGLTKAQATISVGGMWNGKGWANARINLKKKNTLYLADIMNIDHEGQDRQMTSRILILTIENAQLICKIHQV